MWDLRTDTSGPQAEAHGDLLQDALTVFLLREEDSVVADLRHSGVRQDVDVVASETGLCGQSVMRTSGMRRMGTLG